MTSFNIMTKQNCYTAFRKKIKACSKMLICLIPCFVVDKTEIVGELLLAKSPFKHLPRKGFKSVSTANTFWKKTNKSYN